MKILKTNITIFQIYLISLFCVAKETLKMKFENFKFKEPIHVYVDNFFEKLKNEKTLNTIYTKWKKVYCLILDASSKLKEIKEIVLNSTINILNKVKEFLNHYWLKDLDRAKAQRNTLKLKNFIEIIRESENIYTIIRRRHKYSFVF